MRKAVRVVLLFILSLLSTAVLSTLAAILATVSLAATTALIVPGTGTPDANVVDFYRDNFRDYYMQSTKCTNNTDCPINQSGDPLDEGALGIDYPASFWPIPLPGWCPNLSCDTFDVSVFKGVQNLDAALTTLDNAGFDGDLVIAGYSQGARVVTIEKMQFADGKWDDMLERIKLAGNEVSFVYIGNPNRPNGGLLSRLGFLRHIPILNVTTGQPTPTDTGMKTEDWAIRWEGIADWPTFMLNPLAVANSILGFYYDHGTYLAINEDSDPGEIPAGYSVPEWRELTKNPLLYPDNVNVQTYGDTTYYTITPVVLPLVRPLHSIPLIGKPIADLFEPALRVIIEETGYARWIPFGAPIGTGTIPIFNPITLFLKLIPAVFIGINNFLANFGLTEEIPLTPPIPVPAPVTSSLTVEDDLETMSLVDDPDGSSASRITVQDNGEVQQQLDGNELLSFNATQGDPTLPEGTEQDETLPEGTEGTLPDGTEPQGQEGQGNQVEEVLSEDPEESNDPEDNTIDANGGSVSLNFSPNQNQDEGPTGDGEGITQPEQINDPEPSEDPDGADVGADDSEPAAA